VDRETEGRESEADSLKLLSYNAYNPANINRPEVSSNVITGMTTNYKKQRHSKSQQLQCILVVNKNKISNAVCNQFVWHLKLS
jgi:hypothetical protein